LHFTLLAFIRKGVSPRVSATPARADQTVLHL
jgi:hypothetical protein